MHEIGALARCFLPGRYPAVSRDGGTMHFVGIDIAAETHVLAVLDEDDKVAVKPTPFAEDAEGHARLLAALAGLAGVLVVMEATGHGEGAVRAESQAAPASLMNGTRRHWLNWKP